MFSYSTTENGRKLNHRILMDASYFVESQFTMNPNQFVKTIGGFYKKKGEHLEVNLEFNSNFENDGLKNSRWLQERAVNIPSSVPFGTISDTN